MSGRCPFYVRPDINKLSNNQHKTQTKDQYNE
jgi:hypothetical protein